jgi:hypothetical protein
MWLLAAACDTFLAATATAAARAVHAGASGQVKSLSAEEIASWRAVGPELLPRLWQHLRRVASQPSPTSQARAGPRGLGAGPARRRRRPVVLAPIS